jgi:hypothetical protein
MELDMQNKKIMAAPRGKRGKGQNEKRTKNTRKVGTADWMKGKRRTERGKDEGSKGR